MRFSLIALALLLSLTACSDAPSESAPSSSEAQTPEPHADHTSSPLTPAEPRMEDGVQVIDIEAGREGFQPGAVSLAAGIPARLVFTRTVDSECSSQVTVPDFGVAPTDLPMNEPVVIEFTPTQDGDFSFVCGMEMQRGTLVVQS